MNHKHVEIESQAGVKAQLSQNKDHGIWSYHFMENRENVETE